MFQVIVVDQDNAVSAWGPYDTVQQAYDAHDSIAKLFDAECCDDLQNDGWMFHTTDIPT